MSFIRHRLHKRCRRRAVQLFVCAHLQLDLECYAPISELVRGVPGVRNVQLLIGAQMHWHGTHSLHGAQSRSAFRFPFVRCTQTIARLLLSRVRESALKVHEKNCSYAQVWNNTADALAHSAENCALIDPWEIATTWSKPYIFARWMVSREVTPLGSPSSRLHQLPSASSDDSNLCFLMLSQRASCS